MFRVFHGFRDQMFRSALELLLKFGVHICYARERIPSSGSCMY